MHSDAHLNVLLLLCLPCPSLQKIPFTAKMQMLGGTRTSYEREQWPQARGEADSAFEQFKEALMWNL